MKLIIISKNIEIENDDLRSELLEKYPDFEYVFLEPTDENWKIEEIRNFLNKVNKKQSEFTSRIFYILKNGDKLNPVCQNALLKTLEESNYSIGILVKNEASLLPTIKSRCQNIYLNTEAENSDSEDIKFDEIIQLSKSERKDVLSLLEQKMYSSIAIPAKGLFYQEAINKINANCKVEATLIELVENLKSIP